MPPLPKVPHNSVQPRLQFFVKSTYKRAKYVTNLPGSPAKWLVHGVDGGQSVCQGTGVCEERQADDNEILPFEERVHWLLKIKAEYASYTWFV